MHEIIRSIRRIDPADLPRVVDPETKQVRSATPEQLSNMDIIHLTGDLYACAEQRRRDPETLEWVRLTPQHPGQILSAGDAKARYAMLPEVIRLSVMRANILRSTDPSQSSQELVRTTLAEQQTAIDANVGLVIDATLRPLVDLTSDDAMVDEAIRLSTMSDASVQLVNVAMDEVDRARDVVQAESLMPHRWEGERSA